MNDHGPHSEHLRRLAEEFEAATDRGRAEQLAARAVARARAGAPSRRRSPAAAIAGIAMLFVSALGVGALADSAVPGELLYSVDRAFESIGLFTDGAEERLEEAIALADRGDAERAVKAVNEALDVIKQTTPVSIAIPVFPVPESTTTTIGSDSGSTTATSRVTAEAETSVAEPDPVQVLKLAAEYLLRTVRDPGEDGELEQAASELAAAAASLDTTTTTTSTTTTTTVATTTTTQHDNGKGNDPTTTTTTTVPEDGGSTTTTTVPEDGEGSSTTTLPPIILPPAP